MKTIAATKAIENIYKLIDEASEESKPIQITGKRKNAVLISEDDWNSIQETLYLSSIPGLKKSLLDSRRDTSEKWSDKLNW